MKLDEARVKVVRGGLMQSGKEIKAFGKLAALSNKGVQH